MSDPPEPTLAKLIAEFIALRERNDRQHKLQEQTFAQFAAETQAAYHRLRDELTGEKRQSMALLSALVEVAIDLDRLAGAADAAEGIGVASRKTQSLLAGFGVHRYDAAIGSEYRPALHERVGSRAVEGMDAMRVAFQVEPGFASAAPDFVSRRAKVLVTGV